MVRGEDKIISTPDSKVTVCIIPTNEELAIARRNRSFGRLKRKNIVDKSYSAMYNCLGVKRRQT